MSRLKNLIYGRPRSGKKRAAPVAADIRGDSFAP
jgi:hypothetical protein